MADERLRLVAEVTDQFTGPLGKLETALGRAGKAGAKVGADLKTHFDGFQGSLGKATSALQGMTPVLSALGMGGLTAGLSLAGMASALKGFSGGTQQLAIMSRETGLTIDQLRAFGALGERFGVSTQTMQNGVVRFSESMSRLRKRYGEEYTTLEAMNLGELVEKLVAAPNMKVALDTAMDALGQIGDPVKRRKAAEALFGGSEIGAVAGQLPGKVSDVLAEIERRQGKTTDAQINAAQKFEQTFSELRENLDGLRVQALGPLLTSFNDFVKTLTTPQGQNWVNQQVLELKTFVHDAIDELKRLDKWGDSLKGTQHDIKGNTEREIETIAKVYNAIKGLLGIGSPEVQKQSFNGAGGTGPVIQNAAFGGGSMLQNASFGGGGMGGGGPGFGGFGGPLPTLGGGYGLGGTARGGSGGSGGTRSPGNETGQFTTTPPGAAGKYRPQRTLTDRDMSDAVVNTVAGEARLRSQGGADAVINNMFNRLGSKGWGPSRDLHDVARAPGQYAGYRRASESEANFIRERIKAIASGGVPDNTGGSNSFRTSTYRGPWWQRTGRFGKDIAGNTFGYDPSIKNGPYASYKTPKESAEAAVGGEQSGGAASRPGDTVMRRFYGDQAPSMKRKSATGSIDITLGGFGANAKPRANVDDLLKEVPTSKGSQLEMSNV